MRTLLIGLGGIGSEIIDMIYSKLDNSIVNNNIILHAFDTDIHSLRKLNNIDTGQYTQIGLEESIGRHMFENEEINQWFPTNNPIMNSILNGYNLNEGLNKKDYYQGWLLRQFWELIN